MFDPAISHQGLNACGTHAVLRFFVADEVADNKGHGGADGEVPGPGEGEIFGCAVGGGVDGGQADEQNQGDGQADIEYFYRLTAEVAQGLDNKDRAGD